MTMFIKVFMLIVIFTEALAVQQTSEGDPCFDMGNYWCYNNGCVPSELIPTGSCLGSGGNIPAQCPENALCENNRYTCKDGYNETYVNPGGWGNYCEHCSLDHQCVQIYDPTLLPTYTTTNIPSIVPSKVPSEHPTQQSEVRCANIKDWKHKKTYHANDFVKLGFRVYQATQEHERKKPTKKPDFWNFVGTCLTYCEGVSEWRYYKSYNKGDIITDKQKVNKYEAVRKAKGNSKKPGKVNNNGKVYWQKIGVC